MKRERIRLEHSYNMTKRYPLAYARGSVLVTMLFMWLFLPLNLKAGEINDGWPKIVRSGATTGKYIAITIDDAPMPECQSLLDILEQLNIKVTFFVEGEFVERRPNDLIAIFNAGHEIGNHSWGHPNMTKISDESVYRELNDTNEIVFNLTGFRPRLFRPPGGNYNQHLADIAYELEMSSVLWTSSGSDYMEPPVNQLVKKILDRSGPGGIILLHDGSHSTQKALPNIVNSLREKGYTFVTVGEMLTMNYGPCQWINPDDEPEIPDWLVFPYL